MCSSGNDEEMVHGCIYLISKRRCWVAIDTRVLFVDGWPRRSDVIGTALEE